MSDPLMLTAIRVRASMRDCRNHAARLLSEKSEDKAVVNILLEAASAMEWALAAIPSAGAAEVARELYKGEG
jgi:hypothetical protein